MVFFCFDNFSKSVMISVVAILKTSFKWSSVSLVRLILLVNFNFENSCSHMNECTAK